MKYKYVDTTKILPVTPRMEHRTNYMYANKEDIPKNDFKELVIEEKPTYNEKTQKLYSWFENGEVIIQKFKVIDKEG